MNKSPDLMGFHHLVLRNVPLSLSVFYASCFPSPSQNFRKMLEFNQMPKNGRRLPENYRAIVMVSIIFDVVKIASKLQLIKYLVNFSIINDRQFSNRSDPLVTCHLTSLKSVRTSSRIVEKPELCF